MTEQQTVQQVWARWRVVVHPRKAKGRWTLCRCRYLTWAAAQQAAERACTREGGCSNAGVYPEVGGVVQVPGWIKVRAEEGA